MVHEPACPHCGHSLEGAAGLVTCPGCRQAVNAGPPRADRFANQALGAALAAAPGAPGDSPRMPDDSRTCPMCGATIKRAALRCRFCGETFAAAGAPRRALEIGDCFNVAWKLLQRNLTLLALTNLVFFGIQLGVALAGLFAVFFPAVVYTQAHLQAGYVLLLDNLLQGRPAAVRDLFAGGRFAMRTFLATLLLALMSLGGLLLCIIPAYLVPIVFWPFRFVIVHEEAGAIDSLKRSWELISGSFLVSLLLFLVSIAVDSMGSMLCYVGLLFSHGLVELMFGVAYARLAGRPVATEQRAAEPALSP